MNQGMKKFNAQIFCYLKFKLRLDKYYYLLFGLLITLLASCTKNETEEIHENLVITGNIPPDPEGISTVELNNYINNLFIDLYGRAPTAEELETSGTLLKSADYSYISRAELINQLMLSYEYYKNINVLTSQKMLVDIDSVTIALEIDLYEYLIDYYELTGDSLYIFQLEYELQKLYDLISAATDLSAGNIGISEYFRRYLNNSFYDAVNMGSLNFVVSCFENLLQRNPTDDELADGISMVDGNSSQLFLADGNSKQDFLDIITTTPEFYQGQILELFNIYLKRDPTSYEMYFYTNQLMEEDHFNNAKVDLLKSYEYAGF